MDEEEEHDLRELGKKVGFSKEANIFGFVENLKMLETANELKRSDFMIKNAYLYAKTEVLGEKFLKDTKNKYLLIGQSPFNGKIDESGEVILPEGVKVRLQIIEDQSEPVYDKHTGDVKDNNALETFEATIIGKNYPLPFGKGTMVSVRRIFTRL